MGQRDDSLMRFVNALVALVAVQDPFLVAVLRRFGLDMLFWPGTRSRPLNLQVCYSHNGLFAWVWQNLVPLEHARLVFEAVRFQAKSLVNLGQTHNGERRSPAVYRHRRRKAACPAMVWRGERVVGRKESKERDWHHV
ncbi:hypothetical protein QC761_0032260 [Podospora bellae-mahoneyi]|uniref:Secreted protein n=1 Tax=Podospora bellae-mahoneyi TaxID=2093777 RepID=A0ABR0FN75_9PEZI|nr:hypothetical protein QC761_0032260 [Podospora bellae-mahoneyi]